MGSAISIMTELCGITSTAVNLGGTACEKIGSYFGREGKMEKLKDIVKKLERKELKIRRQLEQERSAERLVKDDVERWHDDVGKVDMELRKLREEFEERNEKSWNPVQHVRFMNSLNELTTRVTDLLEEKFDGELTFISIKPNKRPVPAEAQAPAEGAFEANLQKIKNFLKSDGKSKLGIHGMGGSGKTTLVNHIFNHILEGGNDLQGMGDQITPTAYFVTVSRGCHLRELQERIAKQLKLDLSDEQDQGQRAARLLSAWEKQENIVIILDDVWDDIQLDEVGLSLPLQSRGFKMIVTTRSEGVCRGMLCADELIEVGPLPVEEAWGLFKRTLQRDSFDPGVEKVARDVAEECRGLPLAVVTLAKTMRGKKDIKDWRNALQELQDSKGESMKRQVFGVLRFSYDHLEDETMKQCLTRVALYPEDWKMKKKELANVFVGEGLINTWKSRTAGLIKGHSIINDLLDAHLLEKSPDGSIKMHDVVRDMLINMKAEKFLVKAGVGLREIPNEEEWAENLEKVSLMVNKITAIPPHMTSRRYPCLSTLNLRDNPLAEIPDRFFEHMLALKVLDLSYTGISTLPSSILLLEELRTLYLEGCKRLINLPSLTKLRALRELDLSKSGIIDAPEGLEKLENLRCLRLFGCKFGVDVTVLSSLEALSHHFHVARDFNAFVKSMGGIEKLKHYELYLESNDTASQLVSPYDRCMVIGEAEDEERVVFPLDIQEVHFCGIERKMRISNEEMQIFRDLKSFLITGCHSMKCFTSLPSDTHLQRDVFPELEHLQLYDNQKLRTLVQIEEQEPIAAAEPPPLLGNCRIFSLLKTLTVGSCPRIKQLLTPLILPNLANLEYLEVSDCKSMVEIIATEEGERTVKDGNILPKLKFLALQRLPELESICGNTVVLGSLEIIAVNSCRKLKRIPVYLAQRKDQVKKSPIIPSSFRRLITSSNTWWNSLEWDNADTKEMVPRDIYRKAALIDEVKFRLSETRESYRRNAGWPGMSR